MSHPSPARMSHHFCGSPWPEGCGPPRFLVPLRTVGFPFLLSGSCRFAQLPPGSIPVPAAVQRWGWRRSGLSDAKPGLALGEQ